jgi:F-type H+-transporting ATPase subunit epsilon
VAIKLAIVTPEADILQIECDEVVVPGTKGEIGILPGHVPLITGLRPGVLTLIKGGKRTHYAVSNGFAEVEADTVTVLTDSAEEASTVDVARAKKALAEAEELMKTTSPEDATYLETRRRMDRANARIDAAARRS